MSRQLAALAATLLLGIAAPAAVSPAAAQEAQAVRETLNRAQANAGQRAVEDLLTRLRGTPAQAPSLPAGAQMPAAAAIATLPAAVPTPTPGPSTTPAVPAVVTVPTAPVAIAAPTPAARATPQPVSAPVAVPATTPSATGNGRGSPAAVAAATPAQTPASPPTIRVQPSTPDTAVAPAQSPARSNATASTPAGLAGVPPGATVISSSNTPAGTTRRVFRLSNGELCVVEVHPTRGTISSRIIGRS